MTIEIAFHLSAYKNFKTFYLEIVSCYWCKAFPNLVSYNRASLMLPELCSGHAPACVEWQPSTLVPLMAYLRSRLGASTGIGFIDSTSIKVCHNRRIKQHQVFKAIAKRGKTSVDWFAAREACKRR